MAMRTVLLIVSLTFHHACAQSAQLNFSVTEEVSNSFVGSVADSAHLLSRYNRSTIATFGFELAPQANQDGSLFAIDRATGTLRTAAIGIDREEQCPGAARCAVYIDIAIVEPISMFQIMTAQITILDINDVTPRFRQSEHPLAFSEAAPLNSFRMLPQALDEDSPPNTVTEYHLLPANVREFELRGPRQEADGSLRLYVRAALDRERTASYTLQVVAVDGGSPARSATMTLLVSIEDTNDHSPEFTGGPEYRADLSEDTPTGTSFLSVGATDSDEGENGEVTYSLSPNSEANLGHLFGINEISGELFLKSRLDYETQREHVLDVIARDSGVESNQAQARVTVIVLDVNDFVPKVTINALAGTSVMENQEPGTFVAYVSVFDADSGPGGRTNCSVRQLSPGGSTVASGSPAFSLQALPSGAANQYTLHTARSFDRERDSSFALRISCADLGIPSLTGTQQITVTVGDENDNAPVFTNDRYSVSLTENNAAGQTLTRVTTTDADMGENGHVTYSMAAGAVGSYISVNENTGEILARQPLDYELFQELTFDVIAKDGGDPRLSSSAMVTISLIDTNDQAPQFQRPAYQFDVYENEAEVSRVGDVIALDRDSPQWNGFTYSLQIAPQWNVFQIDPTTGLITTTHTLDREYIDEYSFLVIARDSLDPSLVGSASVLVRVLDKNDHIPRVIFPAENNRSLSISTRIPVGQAVTQILADDDDISDNARLTYALATNTERSAANLFQIDATSGAIVTLASLSDLDGQTFTLRITVRDNGVPARNTSTDISITIDSSIPYDGNANHVTDGSENKDEKEKGNMQAIIGVSAASAVIVVALVLIIVIIKLRDSRGCLLCCALVGRRKEKAPVPHYNIEQQEPRAYDALPHNGKVFTVDTIQASDFQVLSGSDRAMLGTEIGTGLTGEHSILYDKRLDKHTNKLQQLCGFHNNGCQDHDDSGSTDASTSDSGRGGSVDGENPANRTEAGRPVPDILQSRSVAAHTNQHRPFTPSPHPHYTEGRAPPSYGSFLRQKRENAMAHSPVAYSIDSGSHTPSSPMPTIPTRSYKNTHSGSGNSSSAQHIHMPATHAQTKSSGARAVTPCTDIVATSALANHCRVRASSDVTHTAVQADSAHIRSETASNSLTAHTRTGSTKRVNFAVDSSRDSHHSDGEVANVGIGKYRLSDVPRSGFTSVMV